MRTYRLGIYSVWPVEVEVIAYICITLCTGMAAQSITPPVDNVVEVRPFTLQCRINRGGDADVSMEWARSDGSRVLPIYLSSTCDRTMTLHPIAPSGLSGSCNIVSGEEVYSVTIENVTVNMEDFTWRCTRSSDAPTVDSLQLSVKVIVTSVSLVSHSTTVVAGTPTTLTCTTSRSKPEACAKWFIQRQDIAAREITTGKGCNQDLTTLQTTSTLQFTATAQDNGAKLFCTAINSVTETPVQSLDYPLSVQYSPEGDITLTGYMTGTPVENGRSEPMSMSCDVGEGNPRPRLTWASVCGNNKVPGNDGRQSISFTVSSSLNGKSCVCRGSQTGTGWTQEKSVIFNITFGPDSVTLSSGTRPIQENSRLTIACTSSESNPAAILSLYNNNILIPSSETTNVSPTTGPNNGYIVSGRYSVRPTRYQDGHVIKCEAYRPGRQDTLVNSQITLDVQYRPLLSNCKDSYTVVENQSIELTCTAWAKPNAQFTWKRGGNSLDDTETDSEHRVTSKISFLRISRSDSGVYVITVENIFGTATRHINVTVQYAPTVTVVALGGTEITEGSNLELECQAEGVPQSYTFSPWTHYVGDIQIPLNNRPSLRLFQINNVIFQDQGFYECSAENDIGGNQSRTEIKIKATPKFPALETQAYSALNKNAKIRVGFVSFPPAIKTTWYKADNVSVSLIGRDSDNDDRYTNKTEDLKHNFTFYEKTVQVSGQVVELGISDVTRMDFQTYLLVVENSIGSSNFTVSLKVADRPCPPVLLTPICGVSKADLSWISCFNGGYEQTFSIEIKRGDEDWTPHPGMFSDSGENKTTSREILELETSQSYSFRVKAENQEGNIYSAEKSCTVFTDQSESSVNIGAAVGGGIAGLAAVIIIVILSVLLFRKSRMKPEAAIRPPEERTVAQFNNGPQEGGVYQDLTINPDYVNTTENQPYASLCQKGREAADYEQCDDPVNATKQYEDMSFSTQKVTPDYMNVYPETTEYENTHKDNSTNYYNL